MRPSAFAAIPLLLCACGSSKPSLPVPGRFTVLFSRDGAILYWDEVPGADAGYHVVHQSPQGMIESGDTQFNSVLVPFTAALGHVLFVSAKSKDGRTSAETAHVVSKQPLPQFSLEIRPTSAEITWDAQALGPGVVARGWPDFEIISARVGGAFEDTGLQPGQRYVWEIIVGSGPDLYISHFKDDQLPGNPPGPLTAIHDGRGFTVSWSDVVSPGGYAVRYTRPSAAPAIFNVGASSLRSNCDGDPSCTFEVAATNGSGVAGLYSPPLTVDATPAIPVPLGAVFATGQVTLTLAGGLPANADHVIISRRSAELGTAYTDVGETRDYLTESIQPWTTYWYVARSVSARGFQSDRSSEVGGYATGASGPVLLNGDSVEHGVGEGAVFVVPHGGYLRAIEVGTLPLPPFLPPLRIDTGGRFLAQPLLDNRASTSLDADLVSGAFTGCCFSIPVSAGQTVAFHLSGTVDMAVGAASDGSGFHLSHGSPDPAHQVVFKAFIDPDDQLAPIGPLTLTQGVEAMRLDWNASPGALRYDVYFTTPDDATPHLIGGTREPWFVDRGLARGTTRFYSVTAVGATGSVSASADFPPNALPDLLAAESLGDAPAAGVELCSPAVSGAHQVGQTFTAQAAGTLWSLEFRVEGSAAGLLDLEVFDDQGNSIGKRTRVAVPSSLLGLTPLDSVVPASLGGVALSSLAIPVTAGQKLRFNLTYPGAGCVTLRDTVAAYAGGEEWLDGAARSDRDLAFRVLVR